ncbi:MAG: N-formylglutamate amidohydrolase [Candidatus Tectimicrobiota bacterium]
MMPGFPIVKHPAQRAPLPILVSIPHYGTAALPHITPEDYTEPWFETFAYGFADTFVGDLYAELHEHGATIVATPFSRIFVDVNRRRNDFEHVDGFVRSQRGVVRTHTMRDVPIFTRGLSQTELEARLQTFYDPYYATLEQLLAGLRASYEHVLLLDSHTGSPRRMQEYQVILGTSHGTTSDVALVDSIATLFSAHGFTVHRNISGYAGGNIVRTYGRPETQQIHAIQIEVNAALLMTTSRQEFIAQVSRGEVPARAEDNVARLQACLQEIIATLPAVLAALPA